MKVVTAKAADMLAEGFGACLPPGVPVPWTAITRAWFVGEGRHRHAVGEVAMWDGQRAVLDVGRHYIGPHAGWTFMWLALDGGNCGWNGAEWVRDGKVAP